MWKKNSYLAMKTGLSSESELISSDLKDLGNAAKKLALHAVTLGGLGFGTSFLQWIASFAAILPSVLFGFFSGEVGKWVAFVAVVSRLFFNKRFPEWLEMPGSLILLIVVAPSLLVDTFRDNLVGLVICLAIGCYLLQEHIRASGGFRNSFTKSNGVSNSVGIILLLVYPVWALVLNFL